MSNPIKYSVSLQNLALRKGNFWIGTEDVSKAPPGETGYWNGITPPSGGYTIYLNKADNGPAIYCPANNEELFSLTNKISGNSFTTVDQCLSYFRNQNDMMCLNRDCETINTNGLIMYYDSGLSVSYPRTGTTLFDMSSTQNNSTTTSGFFPTYDPNDVGGALSFNGTTNRLQSTSPSATSQITLEVWYKTFNISGSQPPPGFGLGFLAGRESAYRLICTATQINWVCATVNNSWYSPGTYEALINLPSQPGTWRHVAGVYNGSRDIVYHNGGQFVASTTFPISGNIANTVAAFGIGYPIGGIPGVTTINSLNGSVAVVRVYNRALTPSEILQNYNSQKKRFGHA
jgi:hypothetical protein